MDYVFKSFLDQGEIECIKELAMVLPLLFPSHMTFLE